VGVSLDDHGPETTLKHVSHPAVGAIEPLGVDAVDLPHAAREVRLGRLDEQVVVVRHQAVGVTDPAAALDDITEDPQERGAVSVSEEDGRAGVSPGRQVIEGAGKLDPEWPGHGLKA